MQPNPSYGGPLKSNVSERPLFSFAKYRFGSIRVGQVHAIRGPLPAISKPEPLGDFSR